MVLALNGAFALFLIYFISRGWGSPGGAPLEYKDFISIILSALAVMLAALTLFVAVAAIWGFAALREEARSSAEQEARETATKVATEVAESVAARTALDVRPPDTSPHEAAEIIGSLNAREAPDGSA